MARFDQQLAKIFEAGGPAAATGTRLGRDMDAAWRQDQGIPLKGQEKQKPVNHTQEPTRLEKAAPATAEGRFLQSLDRLEELAKSLTPTVKPAAPKAAPPEAAKPKPAKRHFGTGLLSLKGVAVQSLDQASIEKRFGKVPQTPGKPRADYAAKLLRSGMKLREVYRAMGFK